MNAAQRIIHFGLKYLTYWPSTPHNQSNTMKVAIRWLIRRDMAEVLDIERTCFEHTWTEEDYLCCLRQRNCIGMVAESDHQIVGVMIYELHKSRLRILNFAVPPWCQRLGVGTQMVRRLVDKLSWQRRQEILLELRESNLAAQLFFRSQGFRAIAVLRRHYDDTAEDAYVMRYQPERFLVPFAAHNRLSEYLRA